MNKEPKNHFIENFKNKLETAKNRDYLIDNEIYQIQTFTSAPEKEAIFIGDLNLANETNSVFDLMHLGSPVYFNTVFNEFLIDGKVSPILDFDGEADLSHKDDLPVVEDDFFKDEREEAIAFAEYFLWLKKLNSPEKNKANSNSETSLTIKQKILALHYLGLDFNANDKVKLAKVLSKILGVGEENTRKYLSYVSAGKNQVRTKENLEKISHLFENSGITELSDKIKSELNK